MTDLVVTTDWLVERLGTSGLRIVEAGHDSAPFFEAHIPGAVYVDWRRDLLASGDDSAGHIIDAESFAALMGRLGIAPSDTVVCYGDHGGRHALRLLWTMEYYGHRQFRFLDGGRELWRAEGRPVTEGETAIEPFDYPVPSSTVANVRASWQDVLAAVRQGDTTLLDVRTRGERDGTDVRAARGGRIPGAAWVDWSQALADNQRLKPVEELRRLFAGAGLERGRPVITYCQLGVRAAHTWFVLKHVLGYPVVANYDGSWREWGDREDLPLER